MVDKKTSKLKENKENNKNDKGDRKKRDRIFKKINDLPFTKLIPVLLFILILILLVSSFSLASMKNVVGKELENIKEASRPAEIELSIIECEECSDISSIVESVKSQNVEVISEETLDVNSERAKELISKYNIQKLPTVLVFGEIDNDKINLESNFELKNDALVFSKVDAPFLDLSSNQIKGLVEVIEIIDSSCKECVPLSYIPLSFVEAGVAISDWKKVEYNSVDGKKFIEKFGISKVPSVLISKEIDYYESISQSLSQLDPSEKQGFYALHSTLPPFRDLNQNKIIGLVDLIMLIDNSCIDCYDVEINKQILQGFGMTPNTENTYDVSSTKGKELILKYNIDKVPIILVSPEANLYALFVNSWSQIGSVEDDGWFVMRSPELLGTVKDLTTNQIISQ